MTERKSKEKHFTRLMCVKITEEQYQWYRRQPRNFIMSRFIREKINEAMQHDSQ